MATAGDARGAGPERAWCEGLSGAVGATVTLDAEESAHLVRSRRVRAGDEVVLFDGCGASRAGRVHAADPRATQIVLGGDYPDRTPTRRVGLAIALPEMGRADRMLAHLAALGVAEVVPLTCARADPGRPAQAGRRAGRWAKLAREAAKVNGAARVLRVGETRSLEAVVAEGAVLLDPDPDAPALGAVLRDQATPPWLVIGPEGGFTDAELAQAREAGATVARLGRPALRVETAAVAAAVVALCG